MTIVRCCFPGCQITGEGVPGRPYACDLHTAWIVTGYRGLKNVAVSFAKSKLEKKIPWWAKAFIDGVKNVG